MSSALPSDREWDRLSAPEQRAEIERRNRARAVGLPAFKPDRSPTPLREIETAEAAKRLGTFPFAGTESPRGFPTRRWESSKPIGKSPENSEEVRASVPAKRELSDPDSDAAIPVAPLPSCVCGHDGELHDGKGHCTACRCLRYRTIEDLVVRKGVEFMRRYGFTYRNLSQKRPSKLAPGVPDALFTHRARGLALLWEAKAPDGVQSEDQREFQLDMDAAGIPYVLGGVEALRQWLTAKLER